MISRNKIKQILSLKTKKGREKEKLFIIEGARCVQSYINSSNLVKEIFMNKDFAMMNRGIMKLCDKQNIVHRVVPDKDMKNLSDTKTPSGIIGICVFKPMPSLDYDSKRWLYLYEISDPGNLGALLRSAAWFNIKNVALSKNSADPLNPKVVRSAVGAHTYLNIYQDIDYQVYLKHEYFIIAADQNGTHQIENSDRNNKIVLVLGNESRGIDASIKNKMNKLISIEKLGHGESLNLAIAGSILMKNIAIK